ncbi:AAA family ATPase [Cylindrospermum sp. FACHB-282]|uniref:AAA family ATPase n=1 Tax=Cylindrospermum sp. FACHB-282 TaxID=2692794 RepID=UPI0016843DA0|nr:AAA family ATPase [Cylindrospermum sp. FACHB-282]MBD2386638.1 ATP-binding protein [Cylindrospermum sp. FACHB-282]
MNIQPFPTSRHSPSYPQEFQQVILEKTQNFVGRDFIFTAIDDFLHHHQRGYFTIVGVPGSGKSAILAQYVKQNPHTIYYNAQIAGKNRVEEFLKEVCTQLSEWLQTPPQPRRESFTENAAEGSWFLSLLLQQVSDKLQPEEKLIIIIDALDAINPNGQPLGTNLFYLPRYLPDGVYFIFSRRPYKKANSGLLIEAPSQILDLSDYAAENSEDIKTYIQRNLTPNPAKEGGKNYSPPLLGERSHLIGEDENNFMYVHQILKAIAEGFYSQASEFDNIPPGLEAYYQQHWQKIQGEDFSDLAVELLRVLTAAQTQAISTVAIAKILNADIYDVTEFIDDWWEFLQEISINKEISYKLYHSSFRFWLARKIDSLL